MNSINRDQVKKLGAQETQMNKSTAQDLGSIAGVNFVQVWDADALHVEYDAARDIITREAKSKCLKHFRNVDMMNAQEFIAKFVSQGLQAYRNRRNELPDIKAANRLEGFNRALEYMTRDAEATLAKFTARVAEDACYAFEWGDGAMEAAAKLHVAQTIAAWMEQKSNDIDAVRKMIRSTVYSNAGSPGHSTSQCSNLMAAYKLAAFASFARGEE